jgi:hypothetical protein
MEGDLRLRGWAYPEWIIVVDDWGCHPWRVGTSDEYVDFCQAGIGVSVGVSVSDSGLSSLKIVDGPILRVYENSLARLCTPMFEER